MSAGPPCGSAACPVPDAPPGRGLRTVVWEAGAELHRGHRRTHPDPSALVPGIGDTRFAPQAGSDHVYLATTSFAALLESALHDAAPPAPQLPGAVLALWCEARVALRHPLRLIDLRDGELQRLGLARSALTATSAAHYPCTRAWAAQLRGRAVGRQPTHGLVWHSRQAELHAQAMAGRPAVADLLDHHPAEVAVVWSPPAPAALLAASRGGLGPLDTGPGRAYVADLTAVLGIVTM